MDLQMLREQAASCRSRAESAEDSAVKDSFLFLAQVYDEEADEGEWRLQWRAANEPMPAC